LIEHVKAVHPATTMVVLTNLAHPEYRARCTELGAHHFFDKSKGIGAFTHLLADLAKRSAESVGKCRTDAI
jgi:DNA-binding NarL/FixJ family response regulator